VRRMGSTSRLVICKCLYVGGPLRMLCSRTDLLGRLLDVPAGAGLAHLAPAGDHPLVAAKTQSSRCVSGALGIKPMFLAG
jgi:hypothetical protein